AAFFSSATGFFASGFLSSPQPISASEAASSARASLVFVIGISLENRGQRYSSENEKVRSPGPFSVALQRLLDREYPLDQGVQVGVGHRRVRRHRRLAPDSGSAFFHLLHQLGLRVLLARVLLRHVGVGGADRFRALDHMAGSAKVFLRER